MAFKRSAVRSRLSPPKMRTHVAKRYMGSYFYIERVFDLITSEKSAYRLQWIYPDCTIQDLFVII